jgi:hypothetical protein
MYEEELAHALGRLLRRHIHTRSSIIYQDISKYNFDATNTAVQSLKELKWCTHLNWRVKSYWRGSDEPRLDISPIGHLISLQQLHIELSDGDEAELPLECLPHLTSLTINQLSLAQLAKIPNPLLLHTLSIAEICDWDEVEDDDDYSTFAELLSFQSLRILRLGDNGKQSHHLNRSHISALMLSLTQLQRLCIDPIALSPTELKQSPSALFGSIPSTLNEIRYVQHYKGTLTPLLAFPSLTKLELKNPSSSSWVDLVELAPRLVSLKLETVSFDEKSLRFISQCTRLTSLNIDYGTALKLLNWDEWKALPLKVLKWQRINCLGAGTC